jgi:eukaryotic-like serine/threonine-protein kinase
MSRPGPSLLDGLGTRGYMAPEQRGSELVTPQADLHVLGIIIFEWLVGAHPEFWPDDWREQLPLLLSERWGTAPASLCDCVTELMAENPADRPKSARIVADVLKELSGRPH